MIQNEIPWTLVTGASKRLGAEIVKQLAHQGHAVVIHYNTSEQDAYALLKQLTAMNAPAAIIQGSFDVRSDIEDFIDRYTKQFKRTKYLINNVGNYVLESMLRTPFNTVESLFFTNVFAPLLLAQGLAGSIIQECGSILNIGVSGLRCGKADVESPIYTMTKQTLLSQTLSLAKELGPHGVSVNMVSPGRLENSVDRGKGAQAIAMQRMGTVEEVARAVSFLLDDANRYITGQNIDVSGGLNL